MPRNPKFNAFAEHALELHDKKSHDYASDNNPYSNFEFAAHYAGITVDQVFDVMIGVKQARLIELTSNNKTPNNESIWDTKRDLAVYAMLKASYSMQVTEKLVSSFDCPGWDPGVSNRALTNFCKHCGFIYDLHPRVEPPA